MTLILSASGPFSTIHVSDRLVTKIAPLKQPIIHDPHANKTVVLRTKDGVMIIGYTGIAYIGNITTDEWIAQTITGVKAEGALGLHGGDAKLLIKNSHTITNAIYVIKKRIEETFLNLQRRSNPTSIHAFSITGWHERNGRQVPFKIIIHNSKADLCKFNIIKFHRYYNWANSYKFLFAPPQNNKLVESMVKNISDSIKGMNGDQADNYVITTLVGTIRHSSQINKMVGGDVMLVYFNFKIGDKGPQIIIKYIPKEQDLTSDIINQDMNYTKAYSPWIITPTHTVKPLVMEGSGWELKSGGINIILKCPSHPNFARFHGQSRPGCKFPT